MVTRFEQTFPSLPKKLREALEGHYTEIKVNFARGHFEPAELNGGKFCEIVFRVLEWRTSGGTYSPLGKSVSRFDQALRRFESLSSFPDSVRFHIPHVLNALYSIRNKRGVAHHAGEIDSNKMDAIFVVSCADWVMAELVRLFHGISLDEAQDLVDKLVTKKIPVVWQIGNHIRIISPPGRKLKTADKVLLILYSRHPEPVIVSELLTWTEYDPRNKPRFRTSILGNLHKSDLIHLDKKEDKVFLSLLGVRFVEDNLPLDF